MINEEPKININGWFELREVSSILGVSKSTILRWTRKNLMMCRYRRLNRRRIWSGKEIIKIWRMII